MKNYFFLLSGNNGATYIFNTSTWFSINESLKFYRAYTFKGKLQKRIMSYFLFVIGRFFPHYCKSKGVINEYLKININSEVDFNLDASSSVLISPTRDKVIVNHHGQYFHKFAFGKSFENVKTEAAIYKLFDTPFKYFKVSAFYDYVDIENKFCHFKLSNRKNKVVENKNNIVIALVDFFKASKLKQVLFPEYFSDLKSKCLEIIVGDEILTDRLVHIEKNIKEGSSILLGLVHRDFKPWNTNHDNGLLIYDFEESVTDGPPLEDLFNYSIAPIVSFESPDKVLKLIFNSKKITEFKEYLKELEIDIDFKVLLQCYFMERICFYKKDKDYQVQQQHIGLWRRFIQIEEKLKMI